MTNLKVCIFTETYYPVIGGGETQARLLAEGLAAAGHTVMVLTRQSDRSLARMEQSGGITVYRLPPVGRGQLKKWGLVLSSLPHLIRLRRRYDVIFVSGFRIIGVSAVLIGKLCRKAIVLKADSQGEMSGEFFRHGLAKLRLSPASFPFSQFLLARNRILRRADAFASITTDTAKEMIAAGVNPRAIHSIPNGVDTARFFPVDELRQNALRAELGLSHANKIVIYTGRLVSYKGLPLLLRVWRELAKQHVSAQLLLVGTGGLDIHNCEDELRAFVEASGLEHCVTFTGGVQNVQDYLQASDIFVLPTEDDALPAALLEAMACGLAVVTTPVGAIKTIITDAENGLMVRPGDCAQLFGALDNLLSDSARAADLGRAGWRTVQARYSATSMTQAYTHLFQDIVHSPQAYTVSSIDNH